MATETLEDRARMRRVRYQIALNCADRAQSRGIRKPRDRADMALNMFLGAMWAAEAMGDAMVAGNLKNNCALLAVIGWEKVTSIIKEGEE